MGHIRLGRLPKRKTWNQVCDLLSSSSDTKNIADSLSKAAKNGLLQEDNQRGLFHTLRYLIKLVNASTTDAFDKALNDIDIQVSPQESGMATLGRILEKINYPAASSGEFNPECRLKIHRLLTKDVLENPDDSGVYRNRQVVIGNRLTGEPIAKVLKNSP